MILIFKKNNLELFLKINGVVRGLAQDFENVNDHKYLHFLENSFSHGIN